MEEKNNDKNSNNVISSFNVSVDSSSKTDKVKTAKSRKGELAKSNQKTSTEPTWEPYVSNSNQLAPSMQGSDNSQIKEEILDFSTPNKQDSKESSYIEKNEHLQEDIKIIIEDTPADNSNVYIDDNFLKEQANQERMEQLQRKKEEKEKIKQAKLDKKREEKERNKGYKNTYIYGFIFILASILLEVSNMVRLGLGFLPVNFGIEFSIILMIAGLIFIVPSEPAKIAVTSIFFGVQLIMNIANASLYKMMYDIITVDMIFTLGFETADAFEFNQLDIPSLITSGIILALFILAIILGSKFAPKFKLKKGKRAIVSMLVLVFSIEILGFSSLNISKFIYFNSGNQAQYLFEDNEYMYSTLNAKFASMKKYGFWSFYINNASIFFNYDKNISKDEMKELTEFVESGNNYSYTNSIYSGENVSGKLAGDNLIVIMMESIEWFAIDPANTPHLYDFIENHAVKFSNFCARNKTNLSEEISLLGSIVNNYSFTTINNNVGINAPNSLPNLLKNSGIETANFFHDYTGEMYDRNTLNKAIGFDEVYTMEQCPIENKSQYFGDFLDDGDFVNAYKSKFMPSDKPFFSFFTTVTTHGPYDKSNNRFTEYYQKFDNNYESYCKWINDNNLNYSTPQKGTYEYNILKEYKSKAMAMDNAINVILNHLKTTIGTNGKPLYDDTTIVLYTDHNAYYSNLCYDVKGLDQYANDKNLYNIPFVIFNKDLPNSKINTFCNTYDIYPTLCDLYGLEFNKSLAQGYSVFSEEIINSVFVSTMCGMFNNDFYTVTFDDYEYKDNSLETNTKLIKFKENINNFLKKQDLIEKYYRINYEKKKATN